MPVLDADSRYIGEVTQDSIADYLSSGRSRRQTGQPAIVSPAVAAAEASAAAQAAAQEHPAHS
jgi:osmoprotectant transport system ATP-binding protein